MYCDPHHMGLLLDYYIFINSIIYFLMGLLEILAVVVFLSTYVFITFETKFNISKASAAMLAGALSWIIVALAKPHHEVQEAITHAGSEIFPVVLFFLTSLTLVEILVHYRFFDMLRAKIYAMHLDDKKQFVIMCLISFFLSAFIDSSAVVLVMVTFATRFFTKENMIKAAVAIITSGNVGGSFSPVGDLTTVLLWLAGKFEATTVISQAFLPNLAMATVVISIMYFSIKPSVGNDDKSEIIQTLSRKEKIISSMVFGTFLLPFAIKPLGLPPYIALLLGLASIWLMIDHLKSRDGHSDTVLAGSIDRLINKIDLPTIKFYVGILLGIHALGVLGILEKLSVIIYGAQPTFLNLVVGHIGLGLATTLVDNVSITSFVIDTLKVTDPNIWTLFAITIGTGGSLSLFGSGAGILAATVVKELTFVKYLKYGFFPILLGYATAVTVWFIQYNIFFR